MGFGNNVMMNNKMGIGNNFNLKGGKNISKRQNLVDMEELEVVLAQGWEVVLAREWEAWIWEDIFQVLLL